MVRLCNIGEVLVVIGIYLLRVGLARLVTKVIPLGRREGELRLLDVLGWEELLQVVPLVDISTADMLDLSSAYDRFARFVARLGWYDCVSSLPLGSMRYGRPTERGQVRNVEPEYFQGWILDFLHSLKGREEGAPELVTAILAIVNRVEAQVQLNLNYLIDGLIFNAVKLLVLGDYFGFHAVQGDAFINQLLWSEE